MCFRAPISIRAPFLSLRRPCSNRPPSFGAQTALNDSLTSNLPHIFGRTSRESSPETLENADLTRRARANRFALQDVVGGAAVSLQRSRLEGNVSGAIPPKKDGRLFGPGRMPHVCRSPPTHLLRKLCGGRCESDAAPLCAAVSSYNATHFGRAEDHRQCSLAHSAAAAPSRPRSSA